LDGEMRGKGIGALFPQGRGRRQNPSKGHPLNLSSCLGVFPGRQSSVHRLPLRFFFLFNRFSRWNACVAETEPLLFFLTCLGVVRRTTALVPVVLELVPSPLSFRRDMPARAFPFSFPPFSSPSWPDGAGTHRCGSPLFLPCIRLLLIRISGLFWIVPPFPSSNGNGVFSFSAATCAYLASFRSGRYGATVLLAASPFPFLSFFGGLSGFPFFFFSFPTLPLSGSGTTSRSHAP